MPNVLVDEGDLYALLRRAGYLAQGALLDWSGDEAARDEYLTCHAEGSREAIVRLRDQLAEHDHTVRTDGMWCKLGLAFDRE